MNIEDIVKRELKSPLFDEELFLYTVNNNAYNTTVDILNILKNISDNKSHKKNIYTMEVFIDEKNNDYDKIISQIEEEFLISNFPRRFDNEIHNWVDIDDMKEKNIILEYDYYLEFCNGEAEDAIYQEMINYWQVEYNNNKKLNIYDYIEIQTRLEQKYNT